jgi:hypothetical protein
MVDAVMASLKVAVTGEVMATTVELLVGVTAVIVGAGGPAVVKDQVSPCDSAVPPADATPVVIVAVYVVL